MHINVNELLSSVTVHEMFFKRAGMHPERPCCSAKLLKGKPIDSYIDFTWGEIAESVSLCAWGLIDLGIRAGDRVAIFSQNRPRWIIADQAIWGACAISVPIYPNSTPEQTKYMLKDSGAKAVFIGDSSQREIARSILQDCPNLEYLISLEPLEPSSDDSILDFDRLELRGKNRRDAAGARLEKAKAEDIAAIIYTSGTTGDPKGVALTHGNFMSNLRQLRQTPLFNAQLKRDILLTNLCHLPLCHVYGRTTDYHMQMMMGGRIAFAQSYYTVPENLFEVRPHIINSIPRFYEKTYSLVKQAVDSMEGKQRLQFDKAFRIGQRFAQCMLEGKVPSPFIGFKLRWAQNNVFKLIRANLGFDRLVLANSGGGPLSDEITTFFRCLLIMMSQGYGLTETSPVLSHFLLEYKDPDHKPSLLNKLGIKWILDVLVEGQSEGKSPYIGINMLKTAGIGMLFLKDAMFREGSVGRPVVDTQIKIAGDGEILAKGPQVFERKHGYWNKPEQTAEVFDEEGWFKTGDIGLLDDKNFLFITDRKKELIVTSGGKNVAPTPIELKLIAKPYIDQAILIGDKRNFISALIVPNAKALRQALRDQGLSHATREELAESPLVRELIKQSVSEVNQELASFEQVKKFEILAFPLTEETGELTPTQKIKRRVVDNRYKNLIESMYSTK